MEEQNLIPFEGKEIRKIWYNDQWYFSVVDVVEVLTDSPIPRNYWTKVKKALVEESQLHPFWMQLKLAANDGRKRQTDCANIEGILRIFSIHFFTLKYTFLYAKSVFKCKKMY